MSFYAVAKGIKKGIYENWNDCKANVEGFENPIYKKFDNLREAKEFIDDYSKIYVYTDGSCINNGKPYAKAGIGIFFGLNDSRNVSRTFEGKQTNNTAELTAILEAIKILHKEIKSDMKIVIVTDSEYAIKCAVTYGHKLALKNWKQDKDKIVPNIELVKELYTISSNFKNISFMHIEAHTDKKDRHSFGNHNADLLANMAVGNLTPKEVDPKNKKYYLKVSFERKDEAKLLGAKWDPKEKKWYYLDNNINKNKLLELFSK